MTQDAINPAGNVGTINDITSSAGTIAITGATGPTTNLEIAQDGATSGQALVWNGTKFAPASVPNIAVATLSSAQILALHSSPVTAVAGVPGAIIVPAGQVVFNFTAVTTPYTASGNVVLSMTNVGGFASVASSGWLTSATSTVRFRAPSTTGFANVSAIVGEALTIWNDTADPTGGDGTATITFPYIIVPIS